VPFEGRKDGRSGGVLERLERLARDLSDTGETGPDEPADLLPFPGEAPESFARRLVRTGRLTSYQAAAALQGKVKGLVVGNYVILDKVGAGGMGMVFKARHRKLKRVVALKALPPSFTRDRAAVLRFQREAQAAAHLSHPNVVTALDADEFKGLHFLVMEFVEGRDLARVVHEDGPLSVDRAVDCVLQAAHGLSAAHARGVVHRDVKPSNLLIDASGTVKVSDLGLARVAGAAERLGGADGAGLTRDGAMMGTVDFMSPEQAFNSKHADERSDVYSLGCTLYFLLTGMPPYPAESVMARLIAHREAPVPSLRDDRPDVPPALDAILARMMAKAPDVRYPTVEALITDLEAFRASPSEPPAPSVPRLDGPRATSESDPTPPPETPGARQKLPPLSTPVKVVATAVIGLTLFALATDRRRQRTGELLVQADANNVRVSIRQGGRAVVSETNRRSFSLPGGEYDVVLDAPSEGLRVSPPHVRVRPGDRTVVRVEPAPKAPPRVPVRDPGPEPDVPAPKAAKRPDTPKEPGLVRTFRHGEGAAESVAVSADGRRAVTAGGRTVRVWDLETGEAVDRPMTARGVVFAVAMTADGRRAVSASADRAVQLWDLDAREELGRFEGHERRAVAVAMTPDGRYVLTGGDDATARLWDVSTREAVAVVPHDGRVNAVALSSDGAVAVTGGDDGAVRLWETGVKAEGTGLSAPPSRLDAGSKVFALAVSRDAHRILAGCEDGTLALWDLNDSNARRTLSGGPRDWVRSVALLPDGRRALAGYQGGKLILWDLVNGRVVHEFDAPPAARLGLAVLPDGGHALSADDDGRVRLWRLPAEAPASDGS